MTPLPNRTRPRPRRRALAAALAAAALVALHAPATRAAARALPRSSPEAQGIASSDVLAFLEAADARVDSMHSFMLVRHGAVVAEAWWAPYDAATPHVLYSLSKSFTSTAVGLAAAEGRLGLDDEVLKFFPGEAPAEPSANLRAMRVRDLLRMVTGNESEAPLWSGAPAAPGDTWARRFLAHPVPFKPGTRFLYNSPGTFMLSAIVQKATGESVLEYLRPKLFDPLGFEGPTWVASPEGVSAGAYGLSARTEEIAKFGQLYLQNGMWEGRRLLPAAWVAEATSLQTSNGSAPASDWDQGYGYQFWRCRHGAYRADGAFGQFCIVIPGSDAVVAITSGVRDMQAVMNLVWDMLLPAMKQGRLPEDAAARARLAARAARLEVLRPAGRASAPAAARVSGRWYDVEPNDLGVRAVALDFSGATPALLVRAADGETRTPVALGAWARADAGFADGLDRALGVPRRPRVAASGAWTADDTFTVRLALYETPYASTLAFTFDGDRLLVDSEYNVAFGQTKQPRLVGRAAR